MQVTSGGMLPCTHQGTHRRAFSMRGVPKDCMADCRSAGLLMLQKSATGTPALWKCCFCRSLSCSSWSLQEHCTAACCDSIVCLAESASLLAREVCAWDASTAQSSSCRKPEGAPAIVSTDVQKRTCLCTPAGKAWHTLLWVAAKQSVCAGRLQESAAAALLHAVLLPPGSA